MARARTIVLWALTAEVALLVVTGVALYFLYRPDAAAAWSNVSASLSREITVGSVLRDVHAWAAWLALPTAIAAAVLLAVRATPTERVGPGLATSVGLAVVVVVAATVTGLLLPWDQLALFAVTVGENISGYAWLRSGDVRFVLIDGTEVAPATLQKWLVLHAVVLGGAVVGLVAVAWGRAHHGSPPAAAVDEPAAEVPAAV